jgi:hypothetical protein
MKGGEGKRRGRRSNSQRIHNVGGKLVAFEKYPTIDEDSIFLPNPFNEAHLLECKRVQQSGKETTITKENSNGETCKFYFSRKQNVAVRIWEVIANVFGKV